MKVKVLTDSGSCMSQSEANSYGLDYLPLQVSIEDKVYMDGCDLTTEDLYNYLEKGYMPQTSLPALGLIEDIFDRYKEEGVSDVVVISLSSGLSSTNSTIQASANWHHIKCHTLDIYSTLATERYWAICAAKLAQEGVHPQEIIARIKESVDSSKGYLIPENLEHLARGGRLSPSAAKLAGMLKIVPILEVSKDSEGKVGKDSEKVRTMSKAIKKTCKLVSKAVDDVEDYEVFVLNSRAQDNAQLAIDELKEQIGEDVKITEIPIGAVIAAHTGLQAVGIQYCRKVKGC